VNFLAIEVQPQTLAILGLTFNRAEVAAAGSIKGLSYRAKRFDAKVAKLQKSPNLKCLSLPVGSAGSKTRRWII
jgi:hypothetical protein